MKALIVANIEDRLNVSESFAVALEQTLHGSGFTCHISDYESDYRTLIEESGYDVVVADVSSLNQSDAPVNALIKTCGDTPVIAYGSQGYLNDVAAILTSNHTLAFHDAAKGTAAIAEEALNVVRRTGTSRAYRPNDI